MRIQKRKSRYARGRAVLSELQEIDLILGPGAGGFKTDQQRREAWIRHRDELLQLHPCPHARVQYDLGGFLPAEGARILLAEQRLRKAGKL